MPPASKSPQLVLYHYPSCWYCRQVREALADLEIEHELRNIHGDPGALDELLEVRGRRTVPVLRIDDGHGVRWMPESRDIVAYLHQLAAGDDAATTPPPQSRGWFSWLG